MQPAVILPDERTLARVAEVIARASGLPAAGERDDHLRRRLAGYLGRHGAAVLDELLRQAERGDGAAIQELRNLLAVNYTYFWRDAQHFQILLEHLLTTLRAKVGQPSPSIPLPEGEGRQSAPFSLREKGGGMRGGTAPQLRLWSAGCASGEEAWSLAIVAAEASRLAGIEASVKILATDIDTAALAQAAQGRYRDEVLEQLPGELRERYLVREKGYWRVGDALRGKVRFAALDLTAAQWPVSEAGPAFDAIFCRNVMIYLTDSARFFVFEKFAALLARDGLLFLSPVEGGVDRGAPYFKPCGDAVYLLGTAARRARRANVAGNDT